MDKILREGNLTMDYNFQNYNYGGNQRMSEGMTFENNLRSLKAKLERKRNVNVFNSNNVICDLCRGYYATHTYRQV